MSINGSTKNVFPQCQIVWYQWKSDVTPVTDPVNDSAEAIAYDLSNHLEESCTFSKVTGNPSGTFSFRLDSSRDWKDLIKPGTWCLIFMSNEGNLKLPTEEGATLPSPPNDLGQFRKNLRGICYIERVSVKGTVNEGIFDANYEVSGRDFGVIYQETELWYNYFVFDEIKVAGLSALMDRKDFNTAADQLRVVHDLFFAAQRLIPSEALGPGNSLTSIGQQWLLPKQLGSGLGLTFDGTTTFYGNLQGLYNFEKTLVTSLIDNPLKFLTGKAWDKLKSLSVPGLHELFSELDDTGYPRLTFRPIPWGIDQKGYPKLASQNIIPTYAAFSEKNAVTIDDAIEIIAFDLGEDNHNRYNHFFTQIENDLIILESNINILRNRASAANRQFPFMDQLSVQRHGFRPMHLKINSLPEKLVSNKGESREGYPNTDLLLEYNEVLFDYHQNAVSFESGSVTIIGRPDVRIGKALVFGPKIPHNADKIFYIEGYTDEWSVDANGAMTWTQTLQVTRGVERTTLFDLLGFGHRTAASPPEVGEFTTRS